MRHYRLVPLAAFVLVLGCTGSESPQTDSRPPARVAASFRAPGSGFIANRGQWEPSVEAVWREGPSTLWVEGDGFHVRRGAGESLVSFTFEGAAVQPIVEMEGERPGFFNFLVGPAERHRTHVAHYERMLVRGVYPGVDVRYRTDEADVAYDLLVDRPASLAAVVLRCDGADRVELSPDGELLAHCGDQVFRQSPPRSWQVMPDGSTEDVASRFVQIGSTRFRFEVEGVAADRPVVVDPGLEWATYVSGDLADEVLDLSVREDGVVFIAGRTSSVTFPVTRAVVDPEFSGLGGIDARDAFVTALTPDGSNLVFSTFLGGEKLDEALGVDVDPAGVVTVVGRSSSLDFPTTPGALVVRGPLAKCFVLKLTPDGSAFVFSATAAGMSLNDSVVDGDGNVIYVGCVFGDDHPTTPGAFQETSPGGDDDGAVVKINATGDGFVFSTFLGGSQNDAVRAVTISGDGSLVLVGSTTSDDFPTTPDVFATAESGFGGVLVRLSADGSTLLGGTFIPSGNGNDVGVDADGNPYIVGQTTDDEYPTTPDAFDTTFNGGIDGWVTSYTADFSRLRHSTYLGGNLIVRIVKVRVDASGVVTAFGSASSSNFPTTPGGFQMQNGGFDRDAFITRFTPDLSRVLYSTYLGGSDDEFTSGADIGGLWVGDEGEVIASALTFATDFPTTPGAFGETLTSLGAPFIAKLDLLPTGVHSLAPSTPGSSGPLAAGVSRMPQVGAADFAVTCTRAPSNANGLLLVGTPLRPEPIDFAGADLWVDLDQPFHRRPATSSELGFSLVEAPIPDIASLAGLELALQFVWRDGGFAATSNALHVTIQP